VSDIEKAYDFHAFCHEVITNEIAHTELDRLKSENAALKETNARLHRRVRAMESKHPERKAILHPDDSAKEINRLNAELRASNEGVKMAALINNIRLKDNLRLKSELAKANADQWIPVSVRLPEPKKFVWAWIENEQRGCELRWRPLWPEIPGDTRGYWQERGPQGYSRGISMWRELPTPPKV
jgi:hypothetical protein